MNNNEIAQLKIGIAKLSEEYGVDLWEKHKISELMEDVNKVAHFLQYIKQKEEIEKNKHYTHIHSDNTDSEYNLNMAKHILQKKIKFLSESDQEAIMLKYTDFQKAHIVGSGGLMISSREGFKKGFKKKKNDLKEVEGNYDILLSLYIKMYSRDEIISYMQKEFGFTISLSALKFFENEYEQQIEKGKSAFQNDFSTIRLTHKSSRLEQLQQLYFRLQELFESTKKVSYVNSMISIMNSIKSEIEGNVKKLEIDINGNININHAIDMERQQNILSSMHIYDIIIARASSIAGKSPLLYIKSLRDSFYSEISGFSNSNKDEAQIRVSPSDFQFKIENLEKLYYQNEKLNESIETIEIFEKQEDKAISKLDVLDNLQEEIKRTKERNSSFDAFYKGDL